VDPKGKKSLRPKDVRCEGGKKRGERSELVCRSTNPEKMCQIYCDTAPKRRANLLIGEEDIEGEKKKSRGDQNDLLRVAPKREELHEGRQAWGRAQLERSGEWTKGDLGGVARNQ